MPMYEIKPYTNQEKREGAPWLTPITQLIPEINTENLNDLAIRSQEDALAQREDLVSRATQIAPLNTIFFNSLLRAMRRENLDPEHSIEKIPLIDIGSGGRIKPILQFSKIMGVSAYIAIDPYDFTYSVKNARNAPLPVGIVAEDVLTFLKRLPEQSASFFISNIGEYTLNATNEILPQIRTELMRTLSPSGGIIVNNSKLTPINNPPIEIECIPLLHSKSSEASFFRYKKNKKSQLIFDPNKNTPVFF